MAEDKGSEDKPKEGATYECATCGMDLLVTSDCNCNTGDGAFFACCGKQMEKKLDGG